MSRQRMFDNADPTAYIKLLMDPFNSKVVSIPDENLRPHVHFSTELTDTETRLNSRDLLYCWLPYNNNIALRQYVKDPVTGRFNLKRFILPAKQLDGSYDLARPIAGGITVRTATQTLTNLAISGTINSIEFNNSMDIRNLSYNTLLRYASQPANLAGGVLLGNGVCQLMPPRTMEYIRPQVDMNGWIGNAGLVNRTTKTGYARTTNLSYDLTTQLTLGTKINGTTLTIPDNMFGRFKLSVVGTVDVPAPGDYGMECKSVTVYADAADNEAVQSNFIWAETQSISAAGQKDYSFEVEFTTCQELTAITFSENSNTLLWNNTYKIELTPLEWYTPGFADRGLVTIVSGYQVNQQMAIGGVFHYEAVPNKTLVQNLSNIDMGDKDLAAFQAAEVMFARVGHIFKTVWDVNGYKNFIQSRFYKETEPAQVVAHAASVGSGIAGLLSALWPAARKIASSTAAGFQKGLVDVFTNAYASSVRKDAAELKRNHKTRAFGELMEECLLESYAPLPKKSRFKWKEVEEPLVFRNIRASSQPEPGGKLSEVVFMLGEGATEEELLAEGYSAMIIRLGKKKLAESMSAAIAKQQQGVLEAPVTSVGTSQVEPVQAVAARRLVGRGRPFLPDPKARPSADNDSVFRLRSRIYGEGIEEEEKEGLDSDGVERSYKVSGFCSFPAVSEELAFMVGIYVTDVPMDVRTIDEKGASHVREVTYFELSKRHFDKAQISAEMAEAIVAAGAQEGYYTVNFGGIIAGSSHLGACIVAGTVGIWYPSMVSMCLETEELANVRDKVEMGTLFKKSVLLAGNVNLEELKVLKVPLLDNIISSATRPYCAYASTLSLGSLAASSMLAMVKKEEIEPSPEFARINEISRKTNARILEGYAEFPMNANVEKEKFSKVAKVYSAQLEELDWPQAKEIASMLITTKNPNVTVEGKKIKLLRIPKPGSSTELIIQPDKAKVLSPYIEANFKSGVWGAQTPGLAELYEAWVEKEQWIKAHAVKTTKKRRNKKKEGTVPAAVPQLSSGIKIGTLRRARVAAPVNIEL